MARPSQLTRGMQVAVQGPVGPTGPPGPGGTVTHTTGALTADRLLVGNGADDTKVLGSAGTATQVLHGGSPHTFSAVDLAADITGTLLVGNGGTGITSYAVGDLLYASGATTLSKLADVAVGSVLVSGGVTTAPAWSATPSVTSLQVGTGVGVLFGGTSASFPGLKRNGPNLEVRLADDSAASNLLLRNLMNSAGDGLYLAASGQPIVSDANVHQWKVSGTGIVNINGNAFYPSSDNAVDLAGTAPNRFRNAYLGTALVVGTNPATAGDVRLGANTVQILKRRNDNAADLNLISGHKIDNNDTHVGDASGPLRLKSNLGTPTSLADGDCWVEATGTTPTRVMALKARDGGVTRTIASVTY